MLALNDAHVPQAVAQRKRLAAGRVDDLTREAVVHAVGDNRGHDARAKLVEALDFGQPGHLNDYRVAHVALIERPAL